MAAVDIQRGRDRGVPDYNTVRVAVGLPRATKWSDISSIPDYQQRLAAAYQSVDDVDLYVGGLAEDRYPSAITSQTFAGLIAAQFLRTRNADPFFYQRPGLFSTDEMTEIQNRTLANMILDHTQVCAPSSFCTTWRAFLIYRATGAMAADGCVPAGADPDRQFDSDHNYEGDRIHRVVLAPSRLFG